MPHTKILHILLAKLDFQFIKVGFGGHTTVVWRDFRGSKKMRCVVLPALGSYLHKGHGGSSTGQPRFVDGCMH